MPDATGPVRFGSGPALALGVEEELLLVDARDHRLAHTALEVLERVRVAPEDGRVIPDTYLASVELVTPVCADTGEAVAALDRLRAAVHRAGGTTIGAGIHPAAPFGEVVHHPSPRYGQIHEMVRGLLARTPTCALHVHVGMPDADTALRAYNGLRGWLPLLQALSASSPFWHGRDSGLASARAQMFRAYPRAELPEAFSSLDHWASAVQAICDQGAAEDYTYIWWDVRLHPRVGTVEVRAMDAQAGHAETAGLVALVHGLARHCAEHGPPPGLPCRQALAEASFLGARDGLGARLHGEPVPVVAERAVELARAAGAGDALEEVGRLVRSGGGAARQRAAYAEGGMAGLLADLAARGTA